MSRYRDPSEREETIEWRAHRDRVGWLAGAQLYLIMDAALACVGRLLRNPMEVSKNTLIKRLRSRRDRQPRPRQACQDGIAPEAKVQSAVGENGAGAKRLGYP